MALSALVLHDAQGAVPAQLTSSHAPVSGAVSNLTDGDLATSCRFARGDVAAPGFFLLWDMGAGVAKDIIGLQVGAHALKSEFMASCILQALGSSGWETLGPLGVFPWPGSAALSSRVSIPELSVRLSIPGSVAAGLGGTSATSPVLAVTVTGGVTLSTDWSPTPGGASIKFSGPGAYLSTPHTPDLLLGAGDFRITFWLKTVASGERVMLDVYAGGVPTPNWQFSLRDGKLSWYSNGYVLSGSQIVNDGVGRMIEVSRVGGILRFFVAGVLDGEIADARDYSSLHATVFGIGAQVSSRNAAYDFAGYMAGISLRTGPNSGGHTSGYTPSWEDGTGGLPRTITASATPSALNFPGALLPVGAATGHLAPMPFLDVYHGGRGVIRATVKQKNTPVNTPLRRRVDLIDERSRLVIRSTWSDPVTGIYAFSGIREDLVYTVVSYDLLHDKRAVIADNLTLANGGVELMP